MPPDETRPVMPFLRQQDHCQGSPNATIALLNYGDYQCPRSGQAHRVLQAIQQRLGEQLCFIFRHFPNTQHPQSFRAAESAEAAAAQGKFWEMHDLLFEHQHHLEDGDLVQYAAQLELEIPQFLREMAGRIHGARVQEDIENACQWGVSETPAFFIGVRHQEIQNLETMLMSLLQSCTS